ncbi:hypothetical protein CO180_02800 [candidate division WWE3 bacterium CG_4_9_14_3_um_filter_41_6]|uniref:Uncharacterized protein n=1 Tax=candidate division WWE3 bacterium CG_4_10_14_0_2_um_filter_41_14 TaxID=1975072 RepID=A0A2M7TJS2_UNCKA|nr:MAG: hypothetical protein COY32_03285 [candidate division WWE3 bacterium CG_4_10_14_0_2_um_filter_41_14]PJA38711.1 MAG: hypothetical protein CO180_02800 [candidate division WWE3 bacterium CG_4_9_14_3_um_filter_41_6]
MVLYILALFAGQLIFAVGLWVWTNNRCPYIRHHIIYIGELDGPRLQATKAPKGTHLYMCEACGAEIYVDRPILDDPKPFDYDLAREIKANLPQQPAWQDRLSSQIRLWSLRLRKGTE